MLWIRNFPVGILYREIFIFLPHIDLDRLQTYFQCQLLDILFWLRHISPVWISETMDPVFWQPQDFFCLLQDPMIRQRCLFPLGSLILIRGQLQRTTYFYTAQNQYLRP